MENNQHTPLGKTGKFGMIERLSASARKENNSTLVGIGDDCTVINNSDYLTLVTTDLLLEGIHFNLIYTPLRHLGYKAVIRGISDVYAMNGQPRQIIAGLGVSSRFSVEQVEEIYEGIRLACDKYKVDLSGGDLTSSLTGLTISITTVGIVKPDRMVKRDGAKVNDLICVTGDFGAAYMGLQLLERERKIFEKDKTFQPDLSGYSYIVGKQLKPEFPVRILEELEKNKILPSAMIDVSDGLASDLLHICKSSGTGCRIYSEKIPVDHETAMISEEFNLDPTTPALNGGEDYELLFTVDLSDFDKISGMKDIRVIGHITTSDSGQVLIGEGGSEITLTAQGWTNKG